MAEKINSQQFAALMQRLAGAWGTQNTEDALACFTADAVYMQPPDVQFYTGHEQLRAYFGALSPGTYLHYQNLWFDEQQQIGCAEFSFGVAGKPKADHGTFVIELRDGLIAHWREYVQKGPADFEDFRSHDGKEWQWHIGNYR
ncbi:MAG: nuclear transport factor 2 family protein [Anaerolineales bacterium]|nr:nuclear transport factor 2 family protein [Anaerolineales bacterium]